MAGADADDLSTAIAVIGGACRVPGAETLEELWHNLRSGTESLSTFSRDELLASGESPERIDDPRYVPIRGVLRDVDRFDAAFFGMTPREAELTDPQHRLLLEIVWEALEDAGYAPGASGATAPVGLFAGETLSTYLFHLLRQPDLRPALGTTRAALGLDRDFLATQVAYKLNLRGPAVTVQSACSTSLVAVCLACRSLQDYECDLAVAGGVSVRVPTRVGHLYQEGGIDSPDGKCRAFDAGAQGTVGGDGGGAVVLKRLPEAVEDGDPIRAVVRGWATNNDGSDRVGFTAPSVDGQAEVIALAHAVAGVEADTITYVEGHGTGTPLGDPIEIAALTEVFREATDRRGFCGLGSVKSNIGHLDAAAGVAGLLKTVLALEHGEIPPSLHFRAPHPESGLETSPFYVPQDLTPWSPGGTPRRAGVSSFGLGGTNAHVVLEEAPVAPTDPAARRRGPTLWTLSARSPDALSDVTGRLARWVESATPSDESAYVTDVGYTLQTGRRAFESRRAVVTSSLSDAIRDLRTDPTDRTLEKSDGPAEAVFLFPGQGTHDVGMGRELYETEPAFRQTVDRGAGRLADDLGLDLREILFPEPGDADEAAARLATTELAQPALVLLELALAAVLEGWGVRPAALVGHSLGEYAAAAVAGVFSFDDVLRLAAVRGRLLQELPRGAMVAVALSERDVTARLPPDLDLAAIDAADRCSVAGPQQAIDAWIEELTGDGVVCRRLDVDRAFHSRSVDTAGEELERHVAAMELHPPTVPLVSGVTGDWIGAPEATEPSYWRRHLRSPVRFADAVTRALESGGVAFEIGPGRSLTALARRGRTGATVLPTLRANRSTGEAAQVLAAVGSFWACGGRVDWDGLHAGFRRRRVSLPTYPFERRSFWIGDLRAAGAPVDTEISETVSPTPSVPARKPAAVPDDAGAGNVEAWLAATWEDLLGGTEGDPGDDFFARGGDSLAALQVLARIRRRFGVELSLGQMLEAPTLGGLSALVRAASGDDVEPRREESPEAPRGIVTFRTEGTAAPLLLLHPAGGHVFGYRDLARRLAPDRPIYGLDAPGLPEGQAPRERIEDLAEHHLESLAALGLDGPVCLGGASMGGTLAWEMACRLRRRGTDVLLVALIDTPGPGQFPQPLADDAEALVYLGSGAVGLTADELRTLPPDERVAHVVERLTEAGYVPEDLEPGPARRLLDLFRSHVRAMTGYRPGPYDGRAVFFRAADRRADDPPHPERAWMELARGGLEVHVVPGDHGSLYHPPHVEELAGRLNRCLAVAEYLRTTSETPCRDS